MLIFQWKLCIFCLKKAIVLFMLEKSLINGDGPWSVFPSITDFYLLSLVLQSYQFGMWHSNVSPFLIQE